MTATAAPHPAFYINRFEEPGDVSSPDPINYSNSDTMYFVDRVASGTNGVVSKDGSFHAEAGPSDPNFQFTRYGGYNSVFPDDGYTTSVDIYFDASLAPVDDSIRLDWSSAISNPSGDHRRDFIFSAGGTGNITSEQFAISASNNAPGWPQNPGRDPLYMDGGWYTLEHVFYDSGSGVLAVAMSVIDCHGIVLKTWILSNPTDIIGTSVGGNRYGWLVNNLFDPLAIDNVIRTGVVATEVSQCKDGGWQSVFRADGSAFKNQGRCIQYVNRGRPRPAAERQLHGHRRAGHVLRGGARTFAADGSVHT